MASEGTESPERVRDPRVYLAVERTFLAWIRTGLSMMGFGFVVARFGLFLRTLYAAETAKAQPNHQISARFGTALVLIGVAVTAASVFRYVRLLRRIDRFEELRNPSRLAIGTAVVLAVIGSMVAAYLLVVT